MPWPFEFGNIRGCGSEEVPRSLFWLIGFLVGELQLLRNVVFVADIANGDFAVFVDLKAADADVVEKEPAHLLGGDALRVIEKSLDRSAVGRDDDRLSGVLANDSKNPVAHPVVDLDQALTARSNCVPAVLIEHVHAMKFREFDLRFGAGQSVHFAEVDLDHGGIDDDGDFVLLRSEAVIERLPGAAERACDTEVDLNVFKIFLEQCTLSLADFVERIVRASLVSQLFVPVSCAVADEIDCSCLRGGFLVVQVDIPFCI